MRGFADVEEDYYARGETPQRVREDLRETVAKMISYALIYRNELWKVRCNAVLKIEMPVERK